MHTHTAYFQVPVCMESTMGMRIFEVAECEDSVSGLVDVHHLYICIDRALESVPGSQEDII